MGVGVAPVRGVGLLHWIGDVGPVVFGLVCWVWGLRLLVSCPGRRFCGVDCVASNRRGLGP